ncbi:MAG: hypothetical protein Q6K90_05805 [Gloeomargarita sp. HHBFW_bins_162]
MLWQFLLQRQDAPRSYCWLQGGQPLRTGTYRLWGRTPPTEQPTVTVEWRSPKGAGRQGYRQQEVAINREGLALLLPWMGWEAGLWEVRCRGEQPHPIWESWSDGLTLEISDTATSPQILALRWQYHCRFPWHQSLRVKGWVTRGQALVVHIHDPLQSAVVLHLQQPLPRAGSAPVPFCCDLAIPQYLYQRVLVAVVEIEGTELRQELLLVNPLVTARLTPQLTVESRSLADLAQQAATILRRCSSVREPGVS